jgi:septal ring factor EnvC (AmiA/AmiB activator)
VFGLALSCALSLGAQTRTPHPSPTPKAGTLAAIAGDRSLKRSPGADGDTPIVITDDNLAQLADGAVITLMTSTVAEGSGPGDLARPDPKTRERWRKKVLAQSAVIARLEAKRRSVENGIDRLERGRLDARALDRISEAEERLAAVDDELQRERTTLSRIIRAARREGAQPGWFR